MTWPQTVTRKPQVVVWMALEGLVSPASGLAMVTYRKQTQLPFRKKVALDGHVPPHTLLFLSPRFPPNILPS